MPVSWIKSLIAASSCAAILTSVSCGTSTSGPSPTPTPAPAHAPAPAPAPAHAPAPSPAPITATVQVTITPSPVPFSGQPITDAASCAGSRNTWFYTQNLNESAGAGVTLTARTDKFDGRVVNNVQNLSMSIAAMGSMAIPTRWCSTTSGAHTAQTTFSGTDANGHAMTVEGPIANLQAK